MDIFNTKKYVDSLFKQELSLKYKREIFNELYDKLKDTNILLIGLRQIGKTSLMIQLAKKYYDEFIDLQIDNNKALKSSTSNNKDKIFYINIKSISGNNEENKQKLFNEITKAKYKLVVLDEIQEIQDWTNFLQSAIDLNKKCKFIVSGSNASVLSKELMVGRFKVFYIQPLLYNEFLNIWEQEDSEKAIQTYLRFGSYPKSNNYYDPEILYREIIEPSIIDKIILDDLKLKPDMHKFKALLEDINNYIGNEINASDIEKKINISRQTIPEYINMMERARLIHTINKYNDKNSKRKKKVYYEDKSLIYLFSSDNEINNNLIGSLVENVVFNYLTYKYLNTTTINEINYFKNNDNKVIDFILKKEKILIECKYIKDLDSNKLSTELNEIIKENHEFINFTKIVVTQNFNSEDINGWKFISLDNFLKGELWH